MDADAGDTGDAWMDGGKKVSSMQPSQPDPTLRRRRRRSPHECLSCRALYEERPSPSSRSGDGGSDERTTVRGHHPTADSRNGARTTGGRLETTRDRGRRKSVGATTTARMAFVLACLALCLVRSTSLSLPSDCIRRGNLHGASDPRTGNTARCGGRWRRLRLPAKFDDDDDEADEDDEYLEKFDIDDLASDVQSTAVERASPAAAVPSSSTSDADEMRMMMERQQSQIDALMSMMMNQQQGLQSQGQQQAQQQETTAAPRAAPQSPAPGPSVAPLKAFLFIDGTWLYYSMHTRGGDRDPIERKFGKGWRNHYRVDW